MIVRVRGLNRIIKATRGLPKDKERAVKSALGSVGFMLIQELKKQIETQGSHASGKWKPQHPLTRLPKQRTGRTQRLRLRQNRPLSGLRKFTRYRTSKTAVQVLFARSKKGKVGSFDRLMNEFVARSEFGETQKLSERAKRFRAARGFPVRKSTSSIRIVPRRTITPVYNKNRRRIPGIFKEKFDASLERQVQKRIDKERSR